jgi:hypothetical protein
LFLTERNIVRFGHPPLKIEIFSSVSGIEFEEAFESRIVDNMDGVDVSLLSLSSLRKNKQASGRFKDLADLEQLPDA